MECDVVLSGRGSMTLEGTSHLLHQDRRVSPATASMLGEYGGSRYFRNVDTYSSDFTASHPRRPSSSYSSFAQHKGAA
jgi:hypothetical protein